MTTAPTFTYNRNQIIFRILRIVGAIASGETPGAQEVTDCADAVNAMISAWQASGLHLWKEKEATLFLQPNQLNYGLGGTSADQCAPTPSLAMTSLTGSGLSSGATVIPIASAAGIADGDHFGIMLSTNAVFWSTVASISGLDITIATPLPASANPSTQIFAYTTRIVRPLRVINARRILWSSLIETRLTQLSRLDFRELPNKTQQGIVNQWFYDPQLSIGQFWAWLNPQDSTNGIRLTYMEPIYNFNAADDQPDFPIEWTNAIIWNGAYEIGPEYDIPPERWSMIEKRAAETLDLAQGFDREPESFYIGVNFDQTSR